jgi:hypothetical protein
VGRLKRKGINHLIPVPPREPVGGVSKSADRGINNL